MKINKNIFICAILVVMMLACVSAVSAADNLDADLAVAADDAVDLSIDDAKGSETLTEGSSSGEILAADETVVTNSTFFNYFDENGVINKSISAKELTFEGNFSNLGVDTITIDTPITISNKNDTMFMDIGFKVISDNVKLTGFDIVRSIDGAAIDIKGNNVTVDDVYVIIENVGKEDTFAIRAIESNNLKLLNNFIYYVAGVDANNTKVYQQAIQVRDSNNVIIRKNHVDAALPALDVDYGNAAGIDQDYPLAVGIQNGENITFAENTVHLLALNASGSYPTLDLMMVKGVKNLEIKDNDFIEMDQNGDKKAGYLYLLDIYAIDGGIISGNNITVNSTTGAEGKGSVYGMQLNGVTTDFVIDNNTFTSEGKSYAYGIYCSDSDYVGGKVYAEITNNLFDITGKPGTGKSNLVTAMELSITEVVIANNGITTRSIANYSDDARLFGICYSSSNKRNHTYTITDNVINTDGKYAVYLMNVVDANVTDNTLFAHELYGDEAVYIDSGNNIVEDNIPPFVVTNDTFFAYFDENGVIKFADLAELFFEGNFSDLGIDTITIDNPVIISGDNTTNIKNIGFKVLSDDVKLTGFNMIRDIDGAAIDIKGANVTVFDIAMNMKSTGKNDTYAIRAAESDGLILIDNAIVYNGGYDANFTKTYQHVIDIRDSDNVHVDGNIIIAGLPTIAVDYGKSGIDQDYPLAVGIQNCKDFVFGDNEVFVNVNNANAWATLDAIMVNNATNSSIFDNEISLTAETEDGNVLYLYAVDLYRSKGIIVSDNDILVNTTSGVDGSGTDYPIQITSADVVIEDNTLVAISKGNSLGIYSSDWAGEHQAFIYNNVIDVTGVAGDGLYSIVSGMELATNDVTIFGNDITVKNKKAYNETNAAYGISFAQSGYAFNTYVFDITNNLVKSDGKYAVYLTKATNSTVTANTLYAHELVGDDAAYVNDGNNVVKDNCPPFVITNETFYNFFGEDNYLASHIPEGATLDFQGLFLGNISDYSVYINKPVNVVSSTGDAVFQYVDPTGDDNHKDNCIKFNVVAGADGTNVSDISIINGDLFVKGASNVTIDNVYMKVNISAIGQSTGFIAIHTGAYYTTVKNSYFENGGSGSSILVLGKGGKYAVFDNNVFNVTGSSGNVVSSNIFVGAGDNPECANYTNNIIYNAMEEAATMYGMTVCGANNIIENNTIFNFKGAGIVNQWGATSTKNVYRNNTITGGASLTAGTYSIIEDNYLEGALTIAEGCNATGNTAKTVSISGKEAVVDNNTFNGAVTIAAAAKNTTFTNNYLKDALTVNSNDNTITGNKISTEKDYAVDLKSTSGNTVTKNVLSSVDKMGDDAVNYAADKNNTVKLNGRNAIIEIAVADAWSGNNNTVNVTVAEATGTVTIIVNGKKFEPIALDKDSKATFEIPANVIEVGLNDVTVDYSGDEIINAETKTTTFYGLDNVVYSEIFFNYFDENGVLKDEVPYDDLVFKGAFAKSSTVQYITINRPVYISSDAASLSLIGMVIASDNVTIDGLKFTTTVNSATSALGDLINVTGDNVVLTNLDITYKVTRGDYDAIAIDVVNTTGFAIFNSTIVFESTVSDDEYSANAINLDGVTNAFVVNNTVTSKLPGLYASNYDWDYFMMGLNTVNPIRIRNVTNISFMYNSIDSGVKSIAGSYPTIQSLYVVGTTGGLFGSNNFTMIDTVSKEGTYTYLYAINFGYDKDIILYDNNFELFTKSGIDSAGGAYAIQIVDSEIGIFGNNITTESNGPNLAVYVASPMMGPANSKLACIGNNISVAGYATSKNDFALVSGIEVQNGEAMIGLNGITVVNKAGYVKDAPVSGVSLVQYGSAVFDIESNSIAVNGDYAVYIKKGNEANVTGNELFAEKYFGDRAVFATEGIIENNTPANPYLLVEFDDITVGETAVFNITYDANDTGDLSLIINGKLYEINATNGTAQINISGLDAGEYTVIAYLTEDYPYGADYFEAVLTVSRFETNMTIDVANVTVGQNAKVTIDLGNAQATGKVIAIIDGEEKLLSLYKGKATTTIKQIEAGDHNIVAIYNGDDNCAAAYAVKPFEILKNDAPISINITPGKAGAITTVNVTLPDEASGVVLITVDEDIYAISLNMNRSVDILIAEPGTYNVTAIYLGDDYYYVNATDIIPVEIADKAVPAINITGPDFVTVGDTVLINITTDTPAELIVTIDNQTYPVVNGTVTYIANESGVHLMAVHASETAEYKEGIIVGVFIVNKNNATVTITLPENITVAEYMNISVVSNSDAEVVVLIDGNEQEVVNGTVTVFNTEGEHSIIAYVNATDAFTDAKAFDSYYVFKKASSVNITGNDVFVGEKSTINVTIPEGASGMVIVTVDNETFYAVEFMHSNTNSIEVAFDKEGNHTVSASYLGDGTYDVSNSEDITIVVSAKETTEANITLPVDYKIGEAANVTVSIPNATGNVSVIVDGTETTVPLDENGTAVVPIAEVTPGEHSVVVIYSGDDKHAPMHTATTFAAEVYASKFANLTVDGAGLISGNLVALDTPIANANITYIINGIDFNTTTDDQGRFSFTAPFPATVQIIYEGTDAIAPVDTEITLKDIAPVREATVIKSSDYETYAIDFDAGERGNYFKVQLFDANGNPLVNKTVFIGFNGKVYNKTTNESGWAELQINLKQEGKYTFATAF
ncbi:Ig-like domain-containing protein, partial [uncultured Methanobrevibacter sp.]|uniref:Ig-like domain-containing protein n=1 Tax=uncultured Methanobrevibacter sp. TaxID=253161 RepID=UPI00260C6C97